MHIILFTLITALFLEQLGQNFLYQKFNFIIDIFGYFQGSFLYICGSLAIIISIFILYKSIKNKTFKPAKWDLCFMLLLGWGLISTLLAEDKELAIIGSHRMDGYFSYLIYAAIYIGVRTLKSEKIRLNIIRYFSLISTFLCYDLIVNDKITSIFFNQNHFGYLLTLSTMLLSGLFIYEKKIYIKVMYTVMFIINIVTLINVDTFGSYLGVLFGMLFTLILVLITKKEKFLVVSTVIALVFFVLVSIAVDSQTKILSQNFNIFGSDVKKISTNAEDVDQAGSYRIALWKRSLEYIKEKPIFGYGPEGVYYDWLSYEDVPNDRPHNEYLQAALFMGIPAAIFYLAGLILLFVYCIKNRKQLPSYAIISGTAVFAYCISAFFGNTMYYTTPYFFMILGMLSYIPNKK